jgi:YVTN family beta-propeller protein
VIFDQPSGRLLTADARSGTVTVLDAASGRRVARVPVGSYPAGLGHCPELRRLYCGNTADGTVTAVDVDTLRPVGTVPAELGAGSIAVDAARGGAPTARTCCPRR